MYPAYRWISLAATAVIASTLSLSGCNSHGAGHIFIHESGDGWGSMYAYECKGCSYGCVHNLRTASSAYHAIRRAGY